MSSVVSSSIPPPTNKPPVPIQSSVNAAATGGGAVIGEDVISLKAMVSDVLARTGELGRIKATLRALVLQVLKQQQQQQLQNNPKNNNNSLYASGIVGSNRKLDTLKSTREGRLVLDMVSEWLSVCSLSVTAGVYASETGLNALFDAGLKPIILNEVKLPNASNGSLDAEPLLMVLLRSYETLLKKSNSNSNGSINTSGSISGKGVSVAVQTDPVALNACPSIPDSTSLNQSSSISNGVSESSSAKTLVITRSSSQLNEQDGLDPVVEYVIEESISEDIINEDLGDFEELNEFDVEDGDGDNEDVPSDVEVGTMSPPPSSIQPQVQITQNQIPQQVPQTQSKTAQILADEGEGSTLEETIEEMIEEELPEEDLDIGDDVDFDELLAPSY